eukprot:TRINITY_DN19114_c0_g1_i8.p1 TRINITY_DN19114_c0_g1~~TRINITY_DN19114_c0_g1_i8.p1  ORF type:complete len:439 (+),score=135.54 TRINITY_DN19114_c0_g1_i8:167-1318(+)
MAFLKANDTDEPAVLQGLAVDLNPDIKKLRRNPDHNHLIRPWKSIGDPKPVNAVVTIAAAEHAGPKSVMEDKYAIKKFQCSFHGCISVGAVCDGHGGSWVAEVAAQAVLNEVEKFYGNNDANKCLKAVIIDAILEVDLKLYQLCVTELDKRYKDLYRQGSTVTVVAVRGNEVTVGWLGDSRAVLCDGDKAVELTRDHNKKTKEEQLRQAAYGVECVLELPDTTRALGDFGGKKTLETGNDQPVSNRAEVSCFSVTDKTDFVIVASDGLWDVVSSQEAVAYVSKLLHATPYLYEDIDNMSSTPINAHRCEEDYLKTICESLIKLAQDRTTSDNITVQLLLLHDIHSYIKIRTPAPSQQSYVCESPSPQPLSHPDPKTPPQVIVG